MGPLETSFSWVSLILNLSLWPTQTPRKQILAVSYGDTLTSHISYLWDDYPVLGGFEQYMTYVLYDRSSRLDGLFLDLVEDYIDSRNDRLRQYSLELDIRDRNSLIYHIVEPDSPDQKSRTTQIFNTPPVETLSLVDSIDAGRVSISGRVLLSRLLVGYSIVVQVKGLEVYFSIP